MKTLKRKLFGAISPATMKTIRRTKHEPQVCHTRQPSSPQMKWLLVLALFALTLHVTLFADENIGFLCLLFSYENFMCVIQVVDIEGKKAL